MNVNDFDNIISNEVNSEHCKGEMVYMNTDIIDKKDGFVIRLAKEDDAINY